jgi:hypothetical protein
MPPPDVEIKKINTESPQRETKEQWLAENPGRGSADFETYRATPEYSKRWEPETRDWTAAAKDYWTEQLPQIDVLEKFDVKLDISRRFSDAGYESEVVYGKLMNRFNNSEFFGATAQAWPLPDAARPEWRNLTAKKEAQVQRSAQDLSSVISRTRVLANEEMSGANVNVPDTTKSAFRSALENIEKALIQWDKLLSGSASPDRQELRKAASELDTRLLEFKLAHTPLFAANTTPSYIKYEVLATVKAVSEKVASQFSARVTEPNMTGMYSRIIDVPRFTRKKLVTNGVKEITSAYNRDLKMFWESKMRGLNVVGGHVALSSDLTTAIHNTSNQYPIADSLNAFRAAYEGVSPNNLSWIHGMSSSVAEITFQITKYQNAVEQVFAKYATAQDVRNDYRKLFDTVTQYIQNRVEVLEEDMRQLARN